ncbi:hypothetical protein LJR267_010559 [Paraburkholderia hospita]|uniref:hypothetical protein n=1 Tax=Paraburkholderia hospita TaxID=169430 RepID=UPI003ECDDC52
MKLAKVKVEYTGGTTITERVTLDPATGQVTLPPRLHALLKAMDETECSPVFGLEYGGMVLPVAVSEGTYKVSIPTEPESGIGHILNAIVYPSKDQRQQNGRYLHTLSAASIGGAVGYAHAAPTLDFQTLVGAVGLAGLGILLWYVGFRAMKGE